MKKVKTSIWDILFWRLVENELYGECEVREDFVCVSFMLFFEFFNEKYREFINGNDLIGKYCGCKREKKKKDNKGGKSLWWNSISSTSGWTSLVVQWLRLQASTAGGTGSIIAQGTGISYTVWHSQKIKNKVQMGRVSLIEVGAFPMSQLIKSGGQSIGASASVLPMNIQGWFPCCPRNSQESSPAPCGHEFKTIQPTFANIPTINEQLDLISLPPPHSTPWD